MRTLEELWYGNINPCEQPIQKGGVNMLLHCIRLWKKRSSFYLPCLPSFKRL